MLIFQHLSPLFLPLTVENGIILQTVVNGKYNSVEKIQKFLCAFFCEKQKERFFRSVSVRKHPLLLHAA